MNELEELKGIIHQTIHVRRVTLSIFLATALFIKLFTRIIFDLSLVVAPFIWLLMTFPFKYLIEQQREKDTLNRIHTGFFLFEIGVITYLIHLMGGVTWIGLIFYIFTVIYANFFLPKRQGYLVTAVVVLFYGLLVLFEYFEVIPHRPLFENPNYRTPAYVLTTLLAGVVGVYVTLAYTVRIFADIYLKKNKELRGLSLRLLKRGEEERRRISRLIHDEVGQTLTAAKISLSLKKTKEAEKLIDEATAQLRELSHSLRPSVLEIGISSALSWLAERFEATGIKVKLKDELNRRLSPYLETLLFRVTQEALTNVKRHAQAKRVTIHLFYKGGVCLSIKDDGKGFDVNSVSGGLGLCSMREQVSLAGGTFKVNSTPGQGTEVLVEFHLI